VIRGLTRGGGDVQGASTMKLCIALVGTLVLGLSTLPADLSDRLLGDCNGALPQGCEKTNCECQRSETCSITFTSDECSPSGGGGGTSKCFTYTCDSGQGTESNGCCSVQGLCEQLACKYKGKQVTFHYADCEQQCCADGDGSVTIHWPGSGEEELSPGQSSETKTFNQSAKECDTAVTTVTIPVTCDGTTVYELTLSFRCDQCPVLAE
jgi:hypothetical protein